MKPQPPLIINQAKDKLKAGEPIFGINIFEALTPSVVKIAANLGFDMLMVDAEHALNDDHRLAMFMALARDNGMAPVATVIAPERALVSRVLDAGAMGIILSHSETLQQMEDLVRWVKYAPEGERGLAMGTSAGYDASDISRYCREANEATLILPKIESPIGVKNAAAIIDVEGVDGVVFGPGDLSAKMGHHGQWEHPEVLAAIDSVVDAAIDRGKAVEPSVMPLDKAAYNREIIRGARIFGATRQTEYDLFRDAANQVLAAYR
jgi:4-hydroxy-2-oxoheptanedioate aldolase